MPTLSPLPIPSLLLALARGRIIPFLFLVVTLGLLDRLSAADSRDPWDGRSFEEVKTAAERGVPSAQVALGKLYYAGKVVPQNTATAVKWLQKAAEQGNAEAQFIVGLAYANGEGVPKDVVAAVKWYRKAAEQGDARAQCNLGLMYSTGEGVSRDAAEAVKWYRKAAEQGDPGAQCNLGVKYFKGEGVPKDAVEAVKWYRKAAEQGYALAQTNLGFMYEKGEGVSRDAAEAAKWYRKAAEQGDPAGTSNNPAAANDPLSKYRTSFRKGAQVFFSDPIQFHDPHALKTIGLIRKQLEDEFGRDRVDLWLKQVLAEMCLFKSGNLWAGTFVNQPFRPDLPTCGAEPSAHFTSELIIGLAHNHITQIERKWFKGATTIQTSDLVEWLKLNIGVDDWSPGMETQALIAGGVTFGDKWVDASGAEWNLKKLLDMDVARWRSNRTAAKLARGAQVPENLLHLGPALIELYLRDPKNFSPYAAVLKEVFGCYADLMDPKGYWGFPGEAFSTGHIMEQFFLAQKAGLKTAPLSLSPLRLMVERQAPDGWFQVSMVSAQAHAIRALGLGLPLLEK